MNFQILSVSNHKVVLQRKKPGLILYFIMGFSLFLMLLGIGLTLSSRPPANLYFQGNAFLFFGILTFYSINSYLKKIKSLYPEEIIFDNKHGYLEIIQDKSLNCKSYIPFHEIESFSLREQLNKHADSSKSAYVISFIKKDGGIWDLIRISKQSEAQKTLDLLTKEVNFSQPSSSLPFSLSSKLEKSIQKKFSELKWRNPVKKYLIPFTISVFLVLGILISFMGLALRENTPVFALILLTIFLLLVLVGIGVQIKNFLKDSSTTYSLRINQETLQYFEEHYSGKITKSRNIYLKDLAGIVFSFKPDESENLIQIKTHEDIKKETENPSQKLSVNAFLKIFGIHREEFFLNTKELNTVEKLQLENWLQQNIRQYMSEASL